MKENNFDEKTCPVKKALEVIGGKWKLRIIDKLSQGTIRYGELKKSIPDISEKMLIQELKSLVALEMIKKKAYPEIPPRVEYSLSPKGGEIIPILDLMKQFGTKL
ncbi:winged helix-turn-helix transcriptional regulator [Algoriphagus sp.]|uniref:winged helix-turn-helix transcriptional regulator n=1 Tax=Algoriphagus sp. TaxID=1872435 RepID=UPI00391C69AC